MTFMLNACPIAHFPRTFACTPIFWLIVLEHCYGCCTLDAYGLHCGHNCTLGYLCHSIVMLLLAHIADLLVYACFGLDRPWLQTYA